MFELYYSLLTQCELAPNKIDAHVLKKNIESLDDEGREYVFGLIYYHKEKHAEQPPNLDVEGKVDIDLVLLPKVLLKILYVFTKMHLHRMKETVEMSKAQQIAARNI